MGSVIRDDSLKAELDNTAIDEISAALEVMTEAWRQADFVESSRWMSEKGWFTSNGTRRPPDGSRTPTEVALMTLVWAKTPEGWRIAHYHESTRPKTETQ